MSQKNPELKALGSGATIKKPTTGRSFHFRYQELCRSKNVPPLPDVRNKNNSMSILDFFGDKITVTDWLLVMEALHNDQVLQTLAIRSRRNLEQVMELLDTEKKAKLYRHKPVVCTKFVFSGLVHAISHCIEFNKNLKVLNLEGLPLHDNYVEQIANAISSNETLKELSFQRSNIQDKGCEAICNTVKYLDNVETLNLSECNLTTSGAGFIAEMIKIQKISRYTEGWQKSLRYREVDPESIPGLRNVYLSRNTQIGDDGVKILVEVLKEDVWIKVVEMENCGLTDRAANSILDCLQYNNYINDFNVRHNPGISKYIHRTIRDQLGKDDEDKNGDGVNLGTKKKASVTQLAEHIKTLESQLVFERMLRKKAEQLNEKLNGQIMRFESQLEGETALAAPDGFVMIRKESLNALLKETNDRTGQDTAEASSISAAPPNNWRPRPQKEQQPQKEVDTYITKTVNSPVDSPKGTRKVMKVRKVKSEMKYSEPPPKDIGKQQESKSDHEFANEADFRLTAVHFETNIGDSTVVASQQLSSTKKGNTSPYDVDELSISSYRSTMSAASTGSETLRNISDHQPMKVTIRRSKTKQSEYNSDDEHCGDFDTPKHTNRKSQMSPRTVYHLTEQLQMNTITEQHSCRQTELKSPRTLFLGL